MLSQRRRHSRWRMFLVLLVFVGLIRHSELTSAGIPESSSLSSGPVARKKSQDIGSLNDFSWQAWFMVDTQAGAQPGVDSATLMRRITPKSVFIAPALPACPDGYVEDNMDRCVKDVNIDESAHFNFLLQRLNALYANQKSSPQEQSQKQLNNGPLQLNIPLMPSTDDDSEKVETIDTLLANDPFAAVVGEIGLENDKKTKHEAVATVYEVKNDTTSDDERQAEQQEESAMFFQESPRIEGGDKTDEKPDAPVPVAEFVEESNDTSFSGVVDYKIPADSKTLLNDTTGSKDATTAGKRVSSTEMSPLMQLLLSTIVPSTISKPETDDLRTTENGTVDHTSHNPAKELANDNAPDFYELPPAWKPSETNKRRDNETRANEQPKGPESPKSHESHETDFIYDEEPEDDEYTYSTDMPDEKSTEAEEILKHGEAGMTIPTRSPIRLHRKRPQQQQQLNQTTDRKKAAAGFHEQLVIRFNDSTPADKDEAGSNVSSEVSIDGDLILETTLLDLNTERLQVTSTQPPDVSGEVATKSDDDDDYSRESYEQVRRRTPAPEVVFGDSYDTASTGAHDRNRAEHSARVGSHVEDERHDETLLTSSSLLYDPPEEEPAAGTHAIDEERFDVPGESALEDDDARSTTPRNTQPRPGGFVRFDNSARDSANHEPLEDYVRFPARQSQTYVRFPSNEANSIHSQLNYKHRSHQTTSDGAYGSTSTKSSVPTRQKPVYHLLAPSWKQPDRQQEERVASVQRQKQASYYQTINRFYAIT
ncbi:PREDICTED: uncharacterized protein LOC106743233 [Dinoponera quadriceps]|uniref:Uncharacterized protein LOC106743233 n=1 Tax=Dinoponera quadriceps TaxID=609295 RepID=A0A6P3X229_DINQU|nr:PREDICTED: uncharacterized protein LOC106743233 [Dinoponera quadriceps]